MKEPGNQITRMFLAFFLKDCQTQAMLCLFARATVTQGPGAQCFLLSFQPHSRAMLLPPLYGKTTIIRRPAVMVVMILFAFGCLKARRLG